MSEEKRIQLIIFGDINVGKTCLLKRYLDNEYDDNTFQTVATDFLSKKTIINSQQAEIRFWDTAGQEKFRSITGSFFKNADGGIVVFDITSLQTFKNVEEWIKTFNDKNQKSGIIVIVGNKSDLSSEREVEYEDAEKLAKSLDIDYFEVSAKNGSNVNDMFQLLEHKCFENLKNIVNESTPINIKEDKKDSQCKC